MSELANNGTSLGAMGPYTDLAFCQGEWRTDWGTDICKPYRAVHPNAAACFPITYYQNEAQHGEALNKCQHINWILIVHLPMAHVQTYTWLILYQCDLIRLHILFIFVPSFFSVVHSDWSDRLYSLYFFTMTFIQTLLIYHTHTFQPTYYNTHSSTFFFSHSSTLRTILPTHTTYHTQSLSLLYPSPKHEHPAKP